MRNVPSTCFILILQPARFPTKGGELKVFEIQNLIISIKSNEQVKQSRTLNFKIIYKYK